VVVRPRGKYAVGHFKVAVGIQVSAPGQSAGRRRGEREDRDRLVSLLEELRPVGEGTRHHARVDEVELLAEFPPQFQVVNLKGYVGRDTVLARGRRVSIAGSRAARDAEGKAYCDGCIGLRSTPMTLAEGARKLATALHFVVGSVYLCLGVFFSYSTVS
jgi:hypothetical protein